MNEHAHTVTAVSVGFGTIVRKPAKVFSHSDKYGGVMDNVGWKCVEIEAFCGTRTCTTLHVWTV